MQLPIPSALLAAVLAVLCAASVSRAADGKLHVEKGEASYVGRAFHNKRTACGDLNNIHELTAAHQTLPCGTMVRVTVIRTKKSVVVRINDRGPFEEDRIIDVTKEAARQLGILKKGVARVRVEALPE